MASKVIKTSRVSPATPLVEPLILPLTFFDLMWLKRNPTEQVIFYRLTESSCDSFYSVILPKLEQSLSLALAHFLPLCGHLKWDPLEPKPHVVVFPHDAVSLTLAETDANFSRISGKGLRPETELRALVPELPVSSNSASVLSLQITLFPNQGFCIGTKVHHAAMDGQTAAKFLKSWAHICKHGTILQDFLIPTLLDRSVVKVPVGLEQKLLELLSYLAEDKNSARTLKLSPLKETDDVVRITLEVTQEKVKKLKEKAKKQSTRSNLHLSTFIVTYAYVWTCMVKMRGGEADRPVRFRYAADCRNWLDPPVPETYFGNCVISIVLRDNKAKTFMGEDGFVNGVEILSDSVKELDQRRFESLWERYEEEKKSMKTGTQVVSVTGSNQFGIYEADFGWGRPVNTEFLSIYQNGQISMSHGRNENVAVEIGISLKKCDMDIFLPLFINGLDY